MSTLKNHAILFCLNVPKGLEIGIDYYGYTVSEQFMGFKDIPAGVHYIYYSLHENAPRTSFFHEFKKNEILIIQWDQKDEDFIFITDNYEQLLEQLQKKHALAQLGPYPRKENEIWPSLSNFITCDLIQKLEPLNRKIFSTYAQESSKRVEGMEDTQTNKRRDFKVYYTHIPNKITKQKISPQELTLLNFDKSELLLHLLKTKYNEDYKQILGELQFAFICFVIGQSYDGLEQWKALLNLLCNSDTASKSHKNLFIDYINVLKIQLEVLPEDFFTSEITNQNFLSRALSNFLEILEDDEIDVKLRQSGKDLKDFVEKRFNWKMEHIIEDDAPVIVEMENLKI